ncbi:MAG: hypothetical protein EOO27_00955 [Comamonadaceae bacterium]|nr:MAG: hypothetical protein EOO27_00955 [Comamonadaceae bacterium]
MTMALVAAGVGAVGGIAAASMNKGGGGGESSTVPFFAGIPGLVQNANYAAELQQGYKDQAFNPQQLAAINNMYGQSDYMRQLIPGLLQQMQGQQVGFDRSNPTARPQAWNFGLLGNAPASAGGGQQPQSMPGLLGTPAIGESAGSGLSLLGQTGVRSTGAGWGEQDFRPVNEQPAPQQATMQQQQGGPVSQAFTQANMPDHMGVVAPSGLKALGGGLAPELMGASGGGGYGGFKYGMNVRDIAADPRMEADARQYFAMGGNDPFDVYGGQFMAADRRRAMLEQAASDRLWNAT